MGIVYQHVVKRIAVLANLDNLQAKALLNQSELIVLAEDEFLAMTYIDGILLAALLIIYGLVGTVVEDDAVLQNLADSSTLVGIGSLQNLDGSRSIGGYGTGEEMATCAKAQFSRTEGILDSAIGARLADEATGAGGRVLPLGQTVDTVVEQNHVQVDVTTVGMDEVVTADSQSVTVARHLPYGQVGVGNLGTCGYGGSTAVDGVHAVGGHIVRQTAGAADT